MPVIRLLVEDELGRTNSIPRYERYGMKPCGEFRNAPENRMDGRGRELRGRTHRERKKRDAADRRGKKDVHFPCLDAWFRAQSSFSRYEKLPPFLSAAWKVLSFRSSPRPRHTPQKTSETPLARDLLSAVRRRFLRTEVFSVRAADNVNRLNQKPHNTTNNP